MTCFEIREIWGYSGCPTDCPLMAGSGKPTLCAVLPEHTKYNLLQQATISPMPNPHNGRTVTLTLDDYEGGVVKRRKR